MAQVRNNFENTQIAIDLLEQEEAATLKKCSAIYLSPINSKTYSDILAEVTALLKVFRKEEMIDANTLLLVKKYDEKKWCGYSQLFKDALLEVGMKNCILAMELLLAKKDKLEKLLQRTYQTIHECNNNSDELMKTTVLLDMVTGIKSPDENDFSKILELYKNDLTLGELLLKALAEKGIAQRVFENISFGVNLDEEIQTIYAANANPYKDCSHLFRKNN